MDKLKKKKDRLELLEGNLQVLLRNDRKNWVSIAKYLYYIETEKLYLLRLPTFTQYVKNLALMNGINVSTLWRAKSAARVYMEISGTKHPNKLKGNAIKTTPEQLEMYGKVQTVAPEAITESLKEKILTGGKVRRELHKLWHLYKPLKKGKTARGKGQRAHISPAASRQTVQHKLVLEGSQELQVSTNAPMRHLAWQEADAEKMKKLEISKEAFLKVNMLNALVSPDWLELVLESKNFQYYTFLKDIYLGSGHQPHAPTYDIAALVLEKNRDKTAPTVIGIKLFTNLGAFNAVKDFQRLRLFCNYFFVVTPLKEDYLKTAHQFPPEVGLLAVSEEVKATRHLFKIIRKGTFKEIGSAYAGLIHSRLLLKALKWN